MTAVRSDNKHAIEYLLTQRPDTTVAPHLTRAASEGRAESARALIEISVDALNGRQPLPQALSPTLGGCHMGRGRHSNHPEGVALHISHQSGKGGATKPPAALGGAQGLYSHCCWLGQNGQRRPGPRNGTQHRT